MKILLNCPSCNSNSYSDFMITSPSDIKNKIYSAGSDEKLSENLSICQNCQLIYMNPQPNIKEIISGYSDATDDNFISQDIFRIKSSEKYIQMLIKKKLIYKNSKVLDVGSGSGTFLKALQNYEIDGQGIEPSSWLSKYSKKKYNLKIHNGTISNFSPEDKNIKFDIITFWDVLEHIQNLNEYLVDASKYLKKGGLLIINFPDHGSLMRKILKRNWPFYLNVHLNYFTKKTLSSFLKKHNYKNILYKPYYQYLSLGYTLERASKYFIFFKYIVNLVTKLKINNIKIKYNMGQTLGIFKLEK